MSKLSQYYAHRQAIEKKTDEVPILNIIEWEQLEERILREETLPQLLHAIEPIISEVRSPLSININYDPDGALVMSFTRNTVQSVKAGGGIAAITRPNNEEQLQEPSPAVTEQQGQEAASQITRSKSIGFTVA